MRLKSALFGLILMFGLTCILSAQTEKISLNIENLPLNTVLNEIEKNSDYTFVVNEEMIDLQKKVTAVFENTAISEILTNIFQDKKIDFLTIGNKIILVPQKIKSDSIPPGNLTGKISDANTAIPLAGAGVQIKGKHSGTYTFEDGSFSMEGVSGNDTLLFSFLGYESIEMPVENRFYIDVELRETPTELESVVVTALGIRRKEKALGYSVQGIDGESLQKIKVVNPATSLTGKISGLLIRNSSNFGTNPVINLRGEVPLIVIDGVPSSNFSLNDLSVDDIKNIDILKGASASALYGYRGANGAVMITTKGTESEKGLSVQVNSSTMVNLGFITKPEIQTSYSSGFNGKYGNDYIWGDKLDIGRTATLWDPYLKEWKENSPLISKGKDNLKNFSEIGMISSNSISLQNQGERSSIRTSISHIFNKGQFPNQIFNKISYSLGGSINIGKLSLESRIIYSRSTSPNIRGNQYSGGYLYNLIGWLGSEWDVRDYSDYWLIKDQKQNWFNNEWYDNPYFLAREVTTKSDRDVLNGFVSATYKLNSWMKFSLRSGLDSHKDALSSQNPVSARNAWSKYGYYGIENNSGLSQNHDFYLSLQKYNTNFGIDGILGGTIYNFSEDSFNAYTKGGLSIPGYYSLKSSVDPIGWNNSVKRSQVNSVFSRISASWKNIAYVDITGRNDWSSTLSQNSRSYFYPSAAGSFIVSEFLPWKHWLDIWKIRASWATSKTPAGIYDINTSYIIYNEIWNDQNSARYPSTLRGVDIQPQTSQSYEFGTSAILFKNRANFDLTIYRKRIYDFLALAPISDASGFQDKYVNTDEEKLKKGIELNIGIIPVKTQNWKWITNLNWSRDICFFNKLDKLYSPNDLWVMKGARVDAYLVKDWERDLSGNIINSNGFPVRSDFYSVAGYANPDWIMGFTSNLQYKRFSFSFSVDGRMGGVSFSRLDALLWNSGAHIGTDNNWRYDEVVNGNINFIGPGVKVVSGSVVYDSFGRIVSDNRIFAPNDVKVSYESYMRSHYALGAWSYASQDILDETFFKLREVSFSWIIPSSFSKKLGMSDVYLSLIGQNLLYWGKEYKFADPDYGQTSDIVSPSLRYVGFNFKFNI